MAYKALIFGKEESVKKMMPLYEREALHGAFEIAAVNFVDAAGETGGG